MSPVSRRWGPPSKVLAMTWDGWQPSAGRALEPPCIPPGSRHPDKQHRNPILLRLVSHVPWALPPRWHGAASPARYTTPSGSCQPAFLSRASPRWATVESLLSAAGLLQPTARAGLQLLCPSRLRICPFCTHTPVHHVPLASVCSASVAVTPWKGSVPSTPSILLFHLHQLRKSNETPWVF